MFLLCYMYDIENNELKKCEGVYKYYFNLTNDGAKYCFKYNYECPDVYHYLNETSNECIDYDEPIIENNEEREKEEIKKQDKILEKVENLFVGDNYNTKMLEEGKDDIIETNKMKITLTTTDNQKNNTNNNMSTIELGECEILLRKFYGISENEKIFMKKIDVIQEGMQIPKIEFEIYAKINGSNLEKLNKSVCEKTKVDLFLPINLTENLDKYNTSSGYFQDICYITTSDDGTDMTLKDRKEDYINNNKMVCEDDCDFSEYDYNIRKVKCSCPVKESSLSFADIKIDKSKLLKNFVDFKNFANIKMLSCYRLLSSKKGIRNNIGFFIISIILFFHIICCFIFYIKGFKKLKLKIDNILFAIKNKHILDSEKNNNNQIITSNKKKKKNSLLIRNNKEKSKNFQNNNLKKVNILNKKNIVKSRKSKNVNKKSVKITYIDIKKKIKKKKDLSTINNGNKIKNFQSKSRNIINNKNQIIINKINKIMKMDDDQINKLTFNLAVKYDKRKYFEYYISLLKEKHLFIFSFINNNDYNSKIIKIDLFFINFVIYFTINSLFYDDDTMHHIYIKKGSFDLEYKLPKIIYSTIISSILNIFLKMFALYHNNISEFKNNKNQKNIDLNSQKLINKIIAYSILFFIISLIFLLFF